MKENREKEKDEKERGKESGIVTRESVSAVCALFSALAFLILCTRSLIFGNIGIAVNSFLLGLFGYLAYPILLAAVYLSVASFIGKRFVRNRKVAATLAVAVVCAMLIVHTAFTYSWDLSGYLSRCFRAPGEGAHGIDAATPAGWAGALLVYPLARLTTRIGALVIFSVLFLLFAYLSVYFWAGKSLPRRAKKTEGKAEKGRGESALPGSGMPAGGEGTFSPPVRENRVRSDGEPVYGTPWPNGSPAAGQARTPETDPSPAAPAEPYSAGQYGRREYAVRPEVRQRPGVTLPDGTPRGTPYPVQLPRERENNAFSPFGTPSAPTAEPPASAADANYEYQKSREFLFGGTPAEIYRKNLIFDNNANVNKRPPADPNQPTVYEGGFSGSYSSAYADSVNGGEEPARPAKILTDNARGKDLYTPRTLHEGGEEPGFGKAAGESDSARNVPPAQPAQSAPPVSPARPFAYGDAFGAETRGGEVRREDFIPPARSAPPEPMRSEPMRSEPVQPIQPVQPVQPVRPEPQPPARDAAPPEEGRGEEKREDSARPSFMDIFSTSNPNIYGLQEEEERPSSREDSERGLFGSRASEEDDFPSARGGEETFRGRAVPEEDEAPEEDRKNIFDEEDDPYSLRSDFVEPDRGRESVSRASLTDDDSAGRRGEAFGRSDGLFGREENREEPAPREKKPEPPPAPKKRRVNVPYQTAPLDYFDCRDVEPDASSEEVENTKQTILETLEAFKVSDATIGSVTYGPTVTRYNVVIPRNISARKVVSLDQEIAMNLYASKGVNIYPNFEDGAVSIEVPNKNRQFVQLGCMLTGDGFTKSKPTALVFAMGKDVGNRKIYGDICKMTHLLVAGASGSGKSVFLRSLIISLIYKYSPQELRLILIDPKKTEFVIYDHLPHLMINEIITEINKVIQSLNWAIGEMNRRYELFEQMSRSGTYVVNVDEYNAALPAGEEKLPKIVIIVDELADLMLSAKKEVEDRIQNLTQKSRAAGIHLILATQRPSADVITGTIKGNLPTRIAFSVASDVDSRVILDASGAQKLLGMGDLLYLMAGMNTPCRVQGASISSEDAQKVVNYIKANNEADFDETVSDFINNTRSAGEDSDDGDDDSVEEVYIDALRYIIQSGSASISMIQRKCSVGYNKAGKIIEWMEDMGYISAFDGAKARKVLITKEEFELKYGPL